MAEYIPCLDFCDGFWFFILLFKNRKGKIHSFWKRYSEKGKKTSVAIFLCNVNMGYSILCTLKRLRLIQNSIQVCSWMCSITVVVSSNALFAVYHFL